MKKLMVFVVSVFLVLVANHTVFSQTVTIDTALANAAREISTSVPAGTRIAVLNITSDSVNLSDYIINELIVNLVNVRAFQVVPRSTIELQLVQGEFDFQMSGYVSDENQRRLGQFLEAGTIITGTITRDTANSYRLLINAIHLENFTYQFSFRGSIRDDQQIKTLLVGRDFVLDNNFTLQQRLGASSLNLLFGAGSFAIQKDTRGGTVTAVFEGLGVVAMTAGMILYQAFDADWADRVLDSYFAYPIFIGLGSYLGGAIYGIVRAQTYDKPSAQISQKNFPFNLELVSSNNQDIDGLRILYNMRYKTKR